jgi:6-pyruvoyltetrahydropterin/6-carboxytetrahydropterin synthase
MFELRVVAQFAAGHRLLDSGTKCEAPHGHNYVLEAFVEGAATDDRGMVVDFSDLKDAIRETLDAWWDHKFLLNSRDTALRSALEVVAPTAIFVFENPTAEVMAKAIHKELNRRGLPVTRVRIWETDKQYAEFRSGGAA